MTGLINLNQKLECIEINVDICFSCSRTLIPTIIAKTRETYVGGEIKAKAGEGEIQNERALAWLGLACICLHWPVDFGICKTSLPTPQSKDKQAKWMQ